MERRNQVEQGKLPSFARRVQDLVHAGDGQLAKAADLIEFLVIDGGPNVSRFLWDDHPAARIRRGRALDHACREVLVQGGVNSFGYSRVDPVGPGSDRRATFRDRNLERHQGEETKVRLGLGENVSKIAENITKLFDGKWGPFQAVKVKFNRAYMLRQRFPEAQELGALFRGQTLEQGRRGRGRSGCS